MLEILHVSCLFEWTESVSSYRGMILCSPTKWQVFSSPAKCNSYIRTQNSKGVVSKNNADSDNFYCHDTRQYNAAWTALKWKSSRKAKLFKEYWPIVDLASLSTANSAFELFIFKSEAKFDPFVSGFYYFLVNKSCFVIIHCEWEHIRTCCGWP